MTLAESAAVVGDLRRARRKQRVAAIHWVDALYQVYITGLVAIVAIVLLSGVIGDGELAASSVADVRDLGPAWMGTLAALAVFTGLRSGSRGGPLALERPDVRHVLRSPVDRGVALRGPAWRQLRFLSAVGLGVGAVAGQLAVRRLPGNPAEWMALGALFGLVVVWLGFGSAVVASGSGLPSWAATLLGGALVVWSVGDVTGHLPTAPGSVAGRLALWPLDADPWALVGPLVAVVLVAAGMRLVSGTSLEAAERRTALVGQLRFAVTLQDLRTVLVLRRQLAQEHPRSRPWVAPIVRRPRFPVVRRGLRSVARWPVGRVRRTLVLAGAAGLAMRGVWAGTTPLLLAVGLALWVAALDAAEPLGQEVDHPGRTDAYPMDRCELFWRHLPVVFAVSVVVGALAGVAAAVPVGDPVPLGVALLVGAVAGLLAGCGAVVSVVQGAPDPVDVLSMTTPEIAGARNVVRTAWPPGLAVLGTLPLLAARAAERGASDPSPILAALTATVPLVAVAVLVSGWVRVRAPLHMWYTAAWARAPPTTPGAGPPAAREPAEREQGGDADDDEEGGDGRSANAGARSGPPARKRSRPAVDPHSPQGVQGGKSAKPIGRKRDQT